MSVLDPLLSLVEQLENEPSLLEPDCLRERLDALDWLDACFPEGGAHDSADEVELTRRARALGARLEALNRALYEAIRADIQSGTGSGTGTEALLRWCDLAANDALVLLGDPGRSYFPKSGIEKLATYRVETTRELEDREIRETSVYRLL